MDRAFTTEFQENSTTSTLGDCDSKSSLDISNERLEELSDSALESYHRRLQKSVRTLRIENVMMERFLERVDPSMMDYVNHSLSHHSPSTHSSPVFSSQKPKHGERSSIDSVTSIHSAGTVKIQAAGSMIERGADYISRLTLPQKMDILEKEIELATTAMEKAKEKWKLQSKRLESEIEIAVERYEFVKNAKEQLEHGIAHKWRDHTTGQISAEKYLRFLKEQIHLVERSMEKYRLKTSTLLFQCKKDKQQLHYKRELNDGFSAIDLEQLRIINNELKKSLETKEQYDLELKNKLRILNLDVDDKKKDLWKLTQELNELKTCIAKKEEALEKINNNNSQITMDMELAVKKHEKLKKLMSKYEAPSVMEYMSKKGELEGLLKLKESLLKRRCINSQSNKDMKSEGNDN